MKNIVNISFFLISVEWQFGQKIIVIIIAPEKLFDDKSWCKKNFEKIEKGFDKFKK